MNKPKYRLLPKPSLVTAQDITDKKNLYKSIPSAQVDTNSRESLTGIGVRAMRKVLPINASMFMQDMTGNKVPLTQDDLSAEESTIMRKTARNATQGGYNSINYSNYPDNGDFRVDPTTFDDLVHAVKNPVHRMQTTIGGAMIKKKGINTAITDSFDFGGADAQDFRIGDGVNKTNKQILKNIATGNKDNIYNNIRNLEALNGSTTDGKGIPVNINLGNLKRPTKEEEKNGLYTKGTNSMKVNSKYKTGCKYVKKAANGLQAVAVPEQGNISNVLSSTASMASAGASIPGAGPWGAAAGAAVGLGIGLFQKDQQDEANRKAVNRNKYLTANRAVAGVDPSVDQKTQVFKDGGNVVVNGKPKYKRADGKVVKRGLWSNTYLSKKEDGTKGVEFSKGQEVAYDRWKADNKINESDDYDMKGYWKSEGFKSAKHSGHFPDTFKKKAPFSEGDGYQQISDESKYSGNPGYQTGNNTSFDKRGQGTWIGDKFVGYAKGTKSTPTKMIEIEGKGTPEIHTDKNFNVKNLGTTPHSKGGNKVEASEGDIVFNTQNSLAKYNKIAAAIQSGDKATLTKEKNRLPEDGGSKNYDGNRGVKPVMYQGKPLPFDDKNKNGQYDQYPAAVAGLANGSSTFLAPNEKSSRGLAYPYSTIENSKGTQYKHNLSTNFGNASIGDGSDLSSTPAAAPFTGTVDMSKVGTDPLVNKANPAVVSPTNTNNGGSNLLQFAGVANNLIQGLRPDRKINESYYDPTLNKYQDRSEATRQASTSTAAIQAANAKNVSGGNASNMRANQNQAAMSNYTRQDAINEQEMGRRDRIEESNVGIRNSAAQYNLQRKDMYQGQMTDQRVEKQQYMDQAASEIGQIGMANREEKYLRDKDDKQNAVQLAGLNRIKTADFATDVNGNQKTALTSAPLTPAATPTSAFPVSSTTPAFNPEALYTGKQTPKQKAAAATVTPAPVKSSKYIRRR